MQSEDRNSHFESPLRYPGGKACIFEFVSKFFYENGLVGMPYAEPYAGGAGLALKLLFRGYVSRIFINDLDFSIFAFWKTLLERNEDFCQWVKDVDVTVENWLYFKSLQAEKLTVDEFELAKSTFFLNRTNVSGVLMGGIIGGLDQKGKFKIDARFNKEDLLKRIRRIGTYKDQIEVSNCDGVGFIKELEDRNSSYFIYVDPPYLQKGKDLYLNAYQHNDHKNLAAQIGTLKKPWMVSYDYHDFILNLYQSHPRVKYRLSQATSNRVGDEILVFGPGLVFEESLAYLQDPIQISTSNSPVGA